MTEPLTSSSLPVRASGEPQNFSEAQALIAGCCHIHHPTLGSDPEFKSVPFRNCAWCQKITNLLADMESAIRASASPSDDGARQPQDAKEHKMNEHARAQSEADGFQDGWHAALKRVSEGDSVSELSALVPVVEPFRNELRAMKAALHGSEARLYPDATYEKYLDELSASLADMVGDAEPDSLDDAALRQAADAISHLRRTRDELRRDLNNVALAASPAAASDDGAARPQPAQQGK